MKDKLFKIFIIFILICTCFTNSSFAKKSDDVDVADEKKNWLKAFFKHPGETITTLVMIPIGYLGDIFQYAANLVQTIPDGTWKKHSIVFSYKYLNDSKKGGKLNEYTKVKEYKKEKSKDAIEVVNDKEFTKKTKIPVIPVDITTMATGNIDAFDVNFFENKKSKQSFIKGLAKATIRAVIYITSAALIITLIWHGIKIATKSLDNPKEMASHKKGLEKFTKALGLMIGSIVIMALFIYGTEAIYNIFTKGNNTKEFPIRLKVEKAGYSFSTNITGYMRYLSLSINEMHCVRKTTYTCTYLILSLINLAMVAIMTLRTLMMWYLSVLGPILALLYVFNIKGPMTYEEWIKQYAKCSAVQIVLSIVCILILNSLNILSI